MKTIAIVTALLALGALPLASAEESTGLCTFPSLPAGACVEAGPGTRTLRYVEFHVGETYSYTCDPFALVCVLTPDAYGSPAVVTVPWVYVETDTWCPAACEAVVDLDRILPALA